LYRVGRPPIPVLRAHFAGIGNGIRGSFPLSPAGGWLAPLSIPHERVVGKPRRRPFRIGER
jgi:hypothetical protein